MNKDQINSQSNLEISQNNKFQSQINHQIIQNSIYQTIIKLKNIFSKIKNKKSCKITNQSFLQCFKKYAKLYSQAYDKKESRLNFVNIQKKFTPSRILQRNL
ncbi:unnamed protein product [Paramecium primaurelia]|uniref:Uncharacterized protein n=1 Tax=Paramecium primaurelia TaxID=5886 RepID=A0A8S1KKH6_PARPR|nr:unnamed protein product [Paramecium primaurelia]